MDLSELPTQKLPAETDDADDAATGSVQKSSKVYNGGANRIAENEENSTTARQSCQEKSVDTSSVPLLMFFLRY